jgi:hypothetical protein
LLGLGKLSTDLRMLKYQILGIVCIDEKWPGFYEKLFCLARFYRSPKPLKLNEE